MKKTISKLSAILLLIIVCLSTNVNAQYNYYWSIHYADLVDSNYSMQQKTTLHMCRTYYINDTIFLSTGYNYYTPNFHFLDSAGNITDTVLIGVGGQTDTTYHVSVFITNDGVTDSVATTFTLLLKSYTPPYIVDDTTVCSFPIMIQYDSNANGYGENVPQLHIVWKDGLQNNSPAIVYDTNRVQIPHAGDYLVSFWDKESNCSFEDSVHVNQVTNPTTVLAINFLVNANTIDTATGSSPVQIALVPIGQANTTSNTWFVSNIGSGQIIDTLVGTNPIFTFPMSTANETYKILCVAADTTGGIPIDECNYDTTSITLLIFPNGGVDANRNGVLDPDEVPPTTGIVDLTTTHQLNVYPNPSNSYFNVDVVGDLQDVKVMSLMGKTLMDSHNKKVDIAHLASGMYLIKVQTIVNGDLRTGTVKFIKK